MLHLCEFLVTPKKQRNPEDIELIFMNSKAITAYPAPYIFSRTWKPEDLANICCPCYRDLFMTAYKQAEANLAPHRSKLEEREIDRAVHSWLMKVLTSYKENYPMTIGDLTSFLYLRNYIEGWVANKTVAMYEEA